MDNYLSELLAVRLDQQPGTTAAHTAIRQWLDNSLSNWLAFDPELPISRQAQYKALQAVADPALINRMDNRLSKAEAIAA